MVYTELANIISSNEHSGNTLQKQINFYFVSNNITQVLLVFH